MSVMSDAIDDYFSFLKQLELQNMEMSYIVDEDGNLIIKYIMRWGFALKRAGENVYVGMSTMFKNGERDRENGALVVGWTASFLPVLYPITHPIKTARYSVKAAYWTVKQGTRLAAAAVGKSWSLAARYGYNYVPSRFLKYAYKWTAWGYALLKHDLARWVISIQEVERLFVGKDWWLKGWQGLDYAFDSETVGSLDGFLRKMFPDFDGDRKMLRKILEDYGTNKHIRKSIIKADYRAREIDPRRWVNWDKSKLAYTIDASMLKKVHDMHVHINGTKDIYTQTVLRNILMHTKDLARAEDLLTISMDVKYAKFLTDQGIDAVQFWKHLGKHAKSIDQIDDVVKYMQEAKAAGKLENPIAFMRNAVANWSKLKGMTKEKRLDQISSMKLNSSFMDRAVIRMKTSIQKTLDTVKSVKMRSPYPWQVQHTIDNLSELIKIKPETYKALKLGWLGTDAVRIKTLSGNSAFIEWLKSLLANKDVIKELKSAKTADAVKSIFRVRGLDINGVPDDLFKEIAQTKNMKRVSDYLEYASNYKELNKLTAILKHPSMKYMWRFVGRVLVVGWPVLTGLGIYADIQEADYIAQTNQERSNNKKQQAWVQWWFGIAADVGAGIWLLAASGALVAIPGIGWVAGWLIVVWLGWRELAWVVYDTIDKYQKNYKDFLQESPLYVKQHIISIASQKKGIDRSFKTSSGQRLSSKDFAHLGDRTWHDAVRALVYFDELSQFPYAAINTANSDLVAELEREYGITRDQIVEQQNALDKNVDKRFAYIKQKLGTTITNWQEYVNIDTYVSNNVIASNTWVMMIDTLLVESQYHMMDEEVFSTPDNTKQHIESIKQSVITSPQYAQLDNLWNSNRSQLLYNYQASKYLLNHMYEFGSEEEQSDLITSHAEYLDKFILYKSFVDGVNIRQITMSVDPATIDYIAIRSFLLDRKAISGTLNLSISSNSEQLGSLVMLSEKDILEQYNTSPNTMQNILYRISTEVLGLSTHNSLEDIYNSFHERNEERHGIYFKNNNKDLCINNRWWSLTWFADDDYSFDGLLSTAMYMRKFRNNIESSMKDNDLIKAGAGTKHMNLEIGQRYLEIFDQELSYIEKPHYHKASIFSYIKEHGAAGYIQLPIDHLLAAVKVWMPDAWEYIYHYDGQKIHGLNPWNGEKIVIFP